MTNIEMLVWGIKHIAENHGFKADTNYREDNQVCIYGGCNVPTISDVHFLCEDLGINVEKCVYTSDCGIDIEISIEWWENKAKKPYEKGMEFWRRKC